MDEQYAVKHATQHGAGDESLFSTALNYLKSGGVRPFLFESGDVW